MEISSACELIRAIVYRPGWKFSPESHSRRFEGTIRVKIEYPAQNTNRDQAPNYPEQILARAEFPIVVSDCDDVKLYRRLLEAILIIEEHEAREYFRIQPTDWAPFHPHRVDGMERWGHPQLDLLFGIA